MREIGRQTERSRGKKRKERRGLKGRGKERRVGKILFLGQEPYLIRLLYSPNLALALKMVDD